MVDGAKIGRSSDAARVDHGSCFCGSVRAKVIGKPFWITYDHDDDCRKALGSPLAIWIGYKREQVTFAEGMLKRFSKTPSVTRFFCANCGTSIAYTDEGLENELWLTIGFMDQPEAFQPDAHGFWRFKLPWLTIADDLPRFDGYTRKRARHYGNPTDR